MQKFGNLFIQRQIQQLLANGESPEQVLNKVLPLNYSEAQRSKALERYNQSKSISKTLAGLGAIQVDESFLPVLIESEFQRADTSALEQILQSNQLQQHTFDLLKSRLSVGLGYALILLAFAAISFQFAARNLANSTELFFFSNSQLLPEFTRTMISWQNSYFPPLAVAATLALVILTVLWQTRRLSVASSGSLLRRLPMLSNIFKYSQCYRWLSILQVMSASGNTLNQSLRKTGPYPIQLKKLAPQLEFELAAADQVETLAAEIDYQLDQLALTAETVVNSSSRKFVALILFFVVSFVFITILAGYQPLFQFGRAI